MKIDLSGRVALVTGATGELGRAMARTLTECGARVALHFHQSEGQARTMQASLAGSAIFRADITKEADVTAMRDAINRELGAPDIVVTNAVIQYKWKDVLSQPAADYVSQFESCVLQNVHVAQAFVPAMVSRRFGRVIAINTECAMQNHPTQSAYVAGKRGMDGVLRVLAREVGVHGITVNQVAPGWMVSENRPAAKRSGDYLDKVPLRRWGNDQDVANAVAFLASDLAGYITGVYLPVCGGNVMPAI
jgi:3-oxoacyl-[acyl-carrier protein] reductase